MKSLRKNTLREILRSPGRFLAILSIIILGSGFFVGLRVSQKAMVKTADAYLDSQAFYDFAVSTTLGLTDDDVDAFKKSDGVLSAEGSVSTDALISSGRFDERVFTFYSLPQEISLPKLVSGRMPQSSGECLADLHSGLESGDVITVSDSNGEDTLDMFGQREFVVVGTAISPLYLNYERGNTSLGTGLISGFIYISSDAFDVDYYTTVYLRMADMPSAYSSAYDNKADSYESAVTDLADERADIRYNSVVGEATSKLDDSTAEYEDGLQKYRTERADAEQKLDEAWSKLEDAYAQIEDGKAQISSGWDNLYSEKSDAEEKLYAAEDKLQMALAGLKDGEQEYADGLQEYEDGFLAYQTGLAEYNDNYAKYEDGLSRYEDGLKEYENGLSEYNANASAFSSSGAQLSAAKTQLDAQQAGFDMLMSTLTSTIVDPSSSAQLYADGPTLLSALQSGDAAATASVNTVLPALAAYDSTVPTNSTALLTAANSLSAGWGEYNANLAAYSSGTAALSAAKSELDSAKKQLDDAKSELDDAKSQLDDAWAQLEDARVTLEDSDEQLSIARAELDSGWAEYNYGKDELDSGWAELNSSVSSGTTKLQISEQELSDAEREYQDGLAEYLDSKADAEKQFSDAEKELADALTALEDGQKEIDDIKYPTAYVLGRWANVGYNCFDSDTTIVKSISSVFPLFFFLVAALICITTITRMVDEQRSQLGVFMALGYSRGSIMSKFIIYSETASVLGCIIGILGGSLVIPQIIWQAYAIMYSFADGVDF